MKVLIVDDDAALLRNIAASLVEHGNQVETAADMATALAATTSMTFDVLVIDVMLESHDDGFILCERLRNAGIATPILLLTARDGVSDRVVGLEAGADDYLVKPFALEELTARLRALTRRHLSHRGRFIESGDLRFDATARTAFIRGRALVLSEKETGLLELLLLYQDRVLTQQEIYERLWAQSKAAMSNLVEVYIGRLRRRLNERHSTAEIQTVKGRGYRLTAAHTAVSTGIE